MGYSGVVQDAPVLELGVGAFARGRTLRGAAQRSNVLGERLLRRQLRVTVRRLGIGLGDSRPHYVLLTLKTVEDRIRQGKREASVV